MEKLIKSLAKSLQENQITNNIAECGNDIVEVSKTLAMLLKDFMDMGFKDVYPYFMWSESFVNNLVDIDEKAYIVGFKGKSIEISEHSKDELDVFYNKLQNLEHALYDTYMPYNKNNFLYPVFEYKEQDMKRKEGQFENEFGRMLDSAFIMRIPIV